MDEPDDAALVAENFGFVTTPLGQPWSGRTRYAAAMFFYRRGWMDAGALEVYRLSAKLDAQDPLPIIEERGVGRDWLARLADHKRALDAGDERQPDRKD